MEWKINSGNSTSGSRPSQPFLSTDDQQSRWKEFKTNISSHLTAIKTRLKKVGDRIQSTFIDTSHHIPDNSVNDDESIHPQSDNLLNSTPSQENAPAIEHSDLTDNSHDADIMHLYENPPAVNQYVRIPETMKKRALLHKPRRVKSLNILTKVSDTTFSAKETDSAKTPETQDLNTPYKQPENIKEESALTLNTAAPTDKPKKKTLNVNNLFLSHIPMDNEPSTIKSVTPSQGSNTTILIQDNANELQLSSPQISIDTVYDAMPSEENNDPPPSIEAIQLDNPQPNATLETKTIQFNPFDNIGREAILHDFDIPTNLDEAYNKTHDNNAMNQKIRLLIDNIYSQGQRLGSVLLSKPETLQQGAKIGTALGQLRAFTPGSKEELGPIIDTLLPLFEQHQDLQSALKILQLLEAISINNTWINETKNTLAERESLRYKAVDIPSNRAVAQSTLKLIIETLLDIRDNSHLALELKKHHLTKEMAIINLLFMTNGIYNQDFNKIDAITFLTDIVDNAPQLQEKQLALDLEGTILHALFELIDTIDNPDEASIDQLAKLFSKIYSQPISEESMESARTKINGMIQDQLSTVQYSVNSSYEDKKKTENDHARLEKEQNLFHTHLGNLAAELHIPDRLFERVKSQLIKTHDE